jgi:hypothetical protein
MWSLLFWNVIQRRLPLSYDVSGQPTAPTFSGQVVQEETWECIIYGTQAYESFER